MCVGYIVLNNLALTLSEDSAVSDENKMLCNTPLPPPSPTVGHPSYKSLRTKPTGLLQS